MKRYSLILLFTIIFASSGKAQLPEADSLKNILNNARHDSTRIRILNELSWYYANLDTEKAMEFAEKNLKLAKSANDPETESDAYRVLGVIFMNAGNNYKALDMALKALKKAESSGNEFLQARALNTIASIYTSEQDHQNGIQYFLKTIKTAKKTKDERLLLAAYLNIGLCYSYINKTDSALYYTNIGLQMAEKMNIEKSKAIAYSNLASAHFKSGSYGLSLEYHRLALAYNKDKQNESLLLPNYLGIADIYKNSQPDSSLYYALRAFKISKKGNFLPQTKEAAEFLADFYKERNKSDSAYFYQSEMIAANDSLFSLERSNRFRSLNFDETLRQQDIEIAKMKKEEERKTNMQYAIAAVGIVSLVILFFLLSNTIFINEKWIRFFGVLALLLVFEFINLMFHSYIAEITNHSPIFMLLILVAIAAVLIPLHHKIEHWISKKVIKKNRRLRLAAAKKTIAELEISSDEFGNKESPNN